MPPAAADLRPAVPRLAAAEQGTADRGRGLPGRPARSCWAAASSSSTGPSAWWSANCTAAPAWISCWNRRARRDRQLPSCRIIPERGSWIEINVTKKDTLSVRIDQSGKFSAMTLLRAMSPKYSSDADMIRALLRDEHVEKIVDGRSVAKIEGKIAVDDIVYPSGQRSGRRNDRRSRPEDHQERGRDDLHVGRDQGRSDAGRRRRR